MYNKRTIRFLHSCTLILQFVTYDLYTQRKSNHEQRQIGAKHRADSPIFPLSNACRNCDSQNPNYANFCYMCGNSLVKFCPACNSRTPLDSLDCSICGNRVVSMRARILDRLIRPTRRRVGLVIMISLSSLSLFSQFIFPVLSL